MTGDAILNFRHTLPVSVLLIALLAGCGGDDSTALLEKAQRHIAQGDTRSAIIELKSAIQEDENNAAARLALGRLQLQLGDFAAAEKELRRARSAGHAAQEINILLAKSLIGQGEYKRLLDEIEEPEATPEAVPLLVARATAQMATNAPDEARQSLDGALKLAPEDPDALLTEAQFFWASRDLNKTVETVERVLQVAPKHRDAWMLKARTQLAQGKPDEAIASYRRALDSDPSFHAARIALADIAIAQNRIPDAQAEIDRILKANPNHFQARYVRAYIHFQEKKLEPAREELSALLRVSPDFAPANLLAGSIDYAQGNLQSAESHLNKALKASPRNPQALRILAAAQVRQGRTEEAARNLNAIPEKFRDAGYHIVAGELAQRERKFDQAAAHFETAAKLNPDDAAIRTELGVARLSMGDNRALTDLQAATSLPGGSERAATLLILDHLRKNQFDQALAALDKMEKQQGASPLVWNYRGAAYLGKKDTAQALASFMQALKLDPGFFPAAGNLAQLDLQNKQPSAARKRFEDILKADPKHLGAMLALANLALADKKGADALAWFDKAAQTHPTALEPRVALARYYLTQGQATQALAQAREAADLVPDNPVVLDLLGTIQFSLKDYPNAIGTLRKLAEATSSSAAAWVKLASVQIAAGQDAEARRSLDSALRSSPGLLEAQSLLGRLDLQQARYEDASKQARQIQSQHPRSAAGHILAGDIANAQKQYDQALAAYERAHALSPTTGTLIQIQIALSNLGRKADAEKRMLSWLGEHPADNVARMSFAESLLLGGKPKLAAEHYRILNRNAPGNPTVLNNLAWALHESGDATASTYAEQALKVRPGDPSIMDTLGWIKIQRGDLQSGIALLQKALSKAPDSADIQWHLASAHARGRNWPAARIQLDKLLANHPDFAQAEEARRLLASMPAR